MEHFYQEIGENWFTYKDFYADMVSYFPTNSHFVEVGSWKGRSAIFMAVEIINSGKKIKFDCVDYWEDHKYQKDLPSEEFVGLYQTFLKNIEPVNHIINPIKAISWEIANKYSDKSLDFVFIDAAHDYESVKKDINAWFPKVKIGGIFAGHDYNTSNDVKKAVDETFSEISERECCWFIKKI